MGRCVCRWPSSAKKASNGLSSWAVDPTVLRGRKRIHQTGIATYGSRFPTKGRGWRRLAAMAWAKGANIILLTRTEMRHISGLSKQNAVGPAWPELPQRGPN